MADEVVSYEFNIPKSLVVELRKHLGIEAKKISRDEAAQELAEARAEKMRKGRLRRQGFKAGMAFQLGDGKTPRKGAFRQKDAGKTL
ncbi:hypothetical protein [Pseudomonas juntendi]|uniref:Uncharacterized protein n=2 Tax=Pseudomonas TaxID=286 RepID=A0AAJ5S6Z2_9PSED|nr:hypothetical protein [Pseudomonas juntendi]WEA23190.1 hypothetical protein PWA60_27265 [Pseudomonas juntendi]